MNQDDVKEVIKVKIDKLIVLSDLIGTGFHKDKIHNFRVTTKMLRSFLRMLKMHMNEPDIKLSAKFKRLYHIAGAIRDAQLELERLTSLALPVPEYLERLHLTLEARKSEWLKHYDKKVLVKLQKRLLDISYEAVAPDVLTNFFLSRMGTIKTLSNAARPTHNQVHTIRKNVKDMLYASKIAKKSWKEVQLQIKMLPVKQLNKLADVIGEFNDERLTLQHLSSFSSKNMQHHEKMVIRHICEEEQHRLVRDKQDIMGLVKQLVVSTV